VETAAPVETWTTGATPFDKTCSISPAPVDHVPTDAWKTLRVSHSHHSLGDDEFLDLEEDEKVHDRRSLLAPGRCPPGAQLTMTPRDFALRPVTANSQNQLFSCGSRVKRRH
jgi:hypothetical protein